MSKNLNPQCKQCRRAGEKLFLKGERCNTAKCAIVKRNYPPGFHGPKGKPRLSDYGTQLYEKQKTKRMYCLLEKQFRLTFEKAKKQKGDSGKNLIKMLETRLDNTIFRLGLAASRSQARQLVNHGHFLVNDIKVNIPSYIVKAGDIIKVRDSSKRSKYFKEASGKVQKTETPSWLDFTKKDLAAKVLHVPTDEDIMMNVNTQIIVEYYSR